MASNLQVGDRVLVVNKKETGGPQKLRSYYEQEIYTVLEAKDERALSKEIARASESKVAAKLLQNGSKLNMNDLMSKGKEINREKRRNELKKKVSKVDQKINRLEMKMNK